MPARRTASTLTGRPSPYNPAVTLFEPVVKAESDSLEEDILGDSSTQPTKEEDEFNMKLGVRRSPRKSAKVQPNYFEDDSLADLEDIVPAVSPKTPARKSNLKASRTPKPSTSPFSTNSFPTKSFPKQVQTPSPKKRKATTMALATPHPAPENWEEVYGLIQNMRAVTPAAVDTMGCHMAGGPEPIPKNKRFSVLVSLMLSPQTKDEVCYAAVVKLREALGGVLSVDTLLAASTSTIQDAINKVGFWRKKTEYIRQSAQIIQDRYNGEVPQDIDELCSLPGVGEKIAFLTLLHAWDLPIGIGVDTHVHRITERLGWHVSKPKTEEATRLNLQSWLPRDKWTEINHLLVGFGQTICQPVRPRCEVCTLSTRNLCPSAAPRVSPPKTTKTKQATKLNSEASEADLNIALEEMGKAPL